jgi:type IV secretory pathway VirB3-like protein
MTYLTYIAVFVVIIIVFVILYKIFRFIISLVLIVVFLLFAFFTNPTEEMHRRAVIEKARKTGTPLRNKRIARENFYVFSLTKVYRGEEKRIVGAGAFTQVFIFSKP